MHHLVLAHFVIPDLLCFQRFFNTANSYAILFFRLSKDAIKGPIMLAVLVMTDPASREPFNSLNSLRVKFRPDGE